ncbi:cobalamin biosynthesis protein CobD/CbiB [Ferrimonas futtsuensis]|uniref:cobalamin biosynthesis protein CobD/CbiB n=1 Tax=Ferrimonas futtsuensis TaxID=364764 RepID=UPI0003FF5761|nr:cobalamin biosynthesis protein [Ferrimonas futtsuensis]
MQSALGPLYPWLAPALILGVAVLINQLLPDRWLLTHKLGTVADAIADKVIHPYRDGAQQRLAGLLSMMIILLPATGVLWALVSLAAYPEPFHILLIAFCLPGRAQQLEHRAMISQLQSGQKGRARQTLGPFTLRRTDNLSEVGLIKAGIESRLVHEARATFSWLLFYPLVGLELAFAIWLIQQLDRQWTPLKSRTRFFGQGVARLSHWLQLPVNALLALTLSLYGRPLAGWQELKGVKQALPGGAHWPQIAMAHHLGAQLGGPWMLEERRLDRPRLGPPQTPTPHHLLRADKILQLARWLWLSLLLIGGIALAMALAGPL